MLTAEQKKQAVTNILPLLNEMTVNDALDTLEYIKGYICDFTLISVFAPSTEQEGANKC